ncbi:MAG: hypothetical protein IPJ69_00070 [Deltaproteobacteria bacterium]|nr:MAG: hypothetical protein IPJ69_00070 [Deltaproteobacteria bacterium]
MFVRAFSQSVIRILADTKAIQNIELTHTTADKAATLLRNVERDLETRLGKQSLLLKEPSSKRITSFQIIDRFHQSISKHLSPDEIPPTVIAAFEVWRDSNHENPDTEVYLNTVADAVIGGAIDLDLRKLQPHEKTLAGQRVISCPSVAKYANCGSSVDLPIAIQNEIIDHLARGLSAYSVGWRGLAIPRQVRIDDHVITWADANKKAVRDQHGNEFARYHSLSDRSSTQQGQHQLILLTNH